MDQVDSTLRTLMLILGGVFGVSWLALGLVFRRNLKYTFYFFLGNLCIGVGAALVAQRAFGLSFWTVQVADWLVIAGITAFWSGVLLLANAKSYPLWTRSLPLFGEMVLTIGLPSDESSYFFRAVVFNAIAGTTSLLTFYDSVRIKGEQENRIIRLFIATPFLCAGALFVLRAGQVGYEWAQGNGFLDHAYRSFSPFLWVFVVVLVITNISNAGMVVAKLMGQLNQLASHDSLTGCLNRRALLERLEGHLRRRMRHQSPLSCALFDLDHFKPINDRYGHEAGDAALVHVCSLLPVQLRLQDEFGRHGGEEFIVVIPDTALEGACRVIDRMRATLEQTPLIFCGQTIPLTASFGLVEWKFGESQVDLLRRADSAMYEAKRKGRNCVVLG